MLFTTAFAVLLTAFLVPSVSAQMLDLDRPSPPVLNDPSSVELKIEELLEQNRGLARRLEIPPRAEAQIACRKLATDLLRSDSPAARLWGFTLADRLQETDALLLDGQIPEAVALFLIEDLRQSGVSLPVEAEEVDRFVRDVFAELSAHMPQAPGRHGWVDRGANPTPPAEFLDSITRWEKQSIIVSALAAELRELVEASEPWFAYAQSARGWSEQVMRGGALLDHAELLGEGSAGEVHTQFARALRDSINPELRESALAELVRLGELATMLERAETLEDRDARQAVIQSVQRAIAMEPGVSQPLDFGLAQTILDLLADRAALPAERSIVRPLRPAWRALSARARQSEIGLVSVLAQALGESTAMSNPGVLAPLGIQRAALDDLRIIQDSNDLLADPSTTSREPVVRVDRRKLAARMLDLGQAISDPDESDDAVRILRQLGAQAAVLSRLDRSAGGLAIVSAELVSDLHDEIKAARDVWIDAWSDGQVEDDEESIGRLRLLAMLSEQANDLMLIGDGPLAIHAWPAFELTPDLADMVTQHARDQIEQTAQVLLDGDLRRARERLESYATEHRIISLIATIERGLRARGLSRSEPAIMELASGSPSSDSWLADRRDGLAELSLLLIELHGARHRNEPRAERDIRRYANYLAKNLAGDLGDSP